MLEYREFHGIYVSVQARKILILSKKYVHGTEAIEVDESKFNKSRKCRYTEEGCSFV